MEKRNVDCWLTDMDGVLVHENKALPGAAELINQWRRQNKPFLGAVDVSRERRC